MFVICHVLLFVIVILTLTMVFFSHVNILQAFFKFIPLQIGLPALVVVSLLMQARAKLIASELRRLECAVCIHCMLNHIHFMLQIVYLYQHTCYQLTIVLFVPN